MKASDYVYVGIKGNVIALARDTGTILWQTELAGSEFVNVVGVREEIFATTRGEIFCLDPASGAIKWHNPLKGAGRGLASIFLPGATDSTQSLLAAKYLLDQQAASAAASTAASSGS